MGTPRSGWNWNEVAPRDENSRLSTRFSQKGSPVFAEQMDARGGHLYVDQVADLRQVLSRDRRQEAVRPDFTVDVAGTAEAFDQEYSNRHGGASRATVWAFT